MKRRFYHVLMLACCLGAPACGMGSATLANALAAPQGSTSANPTNIPAPIGAIANTANYTLVGRFDLSDPNGPICALPNSKIGFTFTGTSLTLNLAELQPSGNDYFNVSIDGNTVAVGVKTPAAGAAYNAYPVATTLQEGTHTAWVQKRTEFLQVGTGSVQFYPPTLSADGAFGHPPAALARHMDFIGDSGFTGYGNLQIMHGASDYCTYSPATQDANLSIPAYTAHLLNADLINISSSGAAVYDSFYDPNPNHLLPVMYTETLPPNGNMLWPVENAPAHVIVVDAGADDLWGASGQGYFPNPASPASTTSDPAPFVAAYTTWLGRLRTANPSALIVCALSPAANPNDAATLSSAINQAVAQETALGDKRVVFYNFFAGDIANTDYDSLATGPDAFAYGCDYHPSPAGSAFLAQRLATFISTQMNTLGISW